MAAQAARSSFVDARDVSTANHSEVVSTLALVIGLVVVNVIKPGAGMNIDASHIDAGSISAYVKAADGNHGFVQFLLDIIPTTIVGTYNQLAAQVPLPSVFPAGLFAFGLLALWPERELLRATLVEAVQLFGHRVRVFADPLDQLELLDDRRCDLLIAKSPGHVRGALLCLPPKRNRGRQDVANSAGGFDRLSARHWSDQV